MHQEGWGDQPYENFRHPDGKARFKLCEQDYGKDNKNLKEVAKALQQYGKEVGKATLKRPC